MDESISNRLLAFSLWTLSLLQGAVFVTDGNSTNRAIGLVAAAAGSLMFFRTGTWGLRGLIAITCLGLANFAAHAIWLVTPPRFPVLFSAVLYGYASFGLVLIAHLFLRQHGSRLALSGCSMWATLMIGHVALSHIVRVELVTTNGATWIGGPVPHPILGEYYAPNSSARTIYPSNPRAYFTQTAPDERSWELFINDPVSQATLTRTATADAAQRVEIARAAVPTAWNIQLARTGLQVRAGETYEVAFSVRAERPRPISVGVGQSHPPWAGLGWYRALTVGTDWQTFSDKFVAHATDDVARVHFDVGETAVPVEIKNLSVRRADTGEDALHSPPPQFYVEYRFNSHGCRGPDYPTPAPADRRRILALGDSFTLGVGVQESDTVTAQLQRLLNADAGARQTALTYDVVNCGVSGYGTHEERLMGDIQSPVYRPNIVLLIMVWNDERSWLEDVRAGYFYRPTNFARAFFPWGLLQWSLHLGKAPPPDFSKSVQEILVIDEHARSAGAQLVVVAFRHMNRPAKEWSALLSTVSGGLSGARVPWLDLGPSLIPGHTEEELVVHPIDPHPNELAHQLAAQSIFQFLRAQGLIK